MVMVMCSPCITLKQLHWLLNKWINESLTEYRPLLCVQPQGPIGLQGPFGPRGPSGLSVSTHKMSEDTQVASYCEVSYSDVLSCLPGCRWWEGLKRKPGTCCLIFMDLWLPLATCVTPDTETLSLSWFRVQLVPGETLGQQDHQDPQWDPFPFI